MIKKSEGYVFTMDVWLYHEQPTIANGRVIDFSNGAPNDNIMVFFGGNRYRIVAYVEVGSAATCHSHSAPHIDLLTTLTRGKMGYRVYLGSTQQSIMSSAVFPTKTWTRVTVMHTAARLATILLDGVAQRVTATGGASLSADKLSGTVLLPTGVRRKNNYIGKSNWKNDKLFKGKMKVGDYRASL